MTCAEATECDASVSAFDMTACVRTYTNGTWIITGGYMVHFTTVINTLQPVRWQISQVLAQCVRDLPVRYDN